MADDLTVQQAIDRAHTLLGERRYEENRAFLEDAVRRFPSDPEIRVMYATALEPFAPDRVREELDLAITLDPESAWNLVRGPRCCSTSATWTGRATTRRGRTVCRCPAMRRAETSRFRIPTETP